MATWTSWADGGMDWSTADTLTLAPISMILGKCYESCWEKVNTIACANTAAITFDAERNWQVWDYRNLIDQIDLMIVWLADKVIDHSTEGTWHGTPIATPIATNYANLAAILTIIGDPARLTVDNVENGPELRAWARQTYQILELLRWIRYQPTSQSGSTVLAGNYIPWQYYGNQESSWANAEAAYASGSFFNGHSLLSCRLRFLYQVSSPDYWVKDGWYVQVKMHDQLPLDTEIRMYVHVTITNSRSPDDFPFWNQNSRWNHCDPQTELAAVDTYDYFEPVDQWRDSFNDPQTNGYCQFLHSICGGSPFGHFRPTHVLKPEFVYKDW